ITAELISRPTIALRSSWVALAALLFYLHFTAALLIPAELVGYALTRLARREAAAYRWTSLAADVAILTLICLPAASTLQVIYARRANWDAFIPLQSLWAIFAWWPYALGLAYIAAALATDRLVVTTNEPPAADHRRLVFSAL